jgi:hypothetical protein
MTRVCSIADLVIIHGTDLRIGAKSATDDDRRIRNEIKKHVVCNEFGDGGKQND